MTSQRHIIGWTVRTPECQEGPMIHPEETETLWRMDGWDEETVASFCEVNDSTVIEFVFGLHPDTQTQVPQGYVGER